jgi:hypothetical protein
MDSRRAEHLEHAPNFSCRKGGAELCVNIGDHIVKGQKLNWIATNGVSKRLVGFPNIRLTNNLGNC